ncbi:DUF397 domain-containing protein [Streptomyces triticagri]|uniref:DUF397 domain-containing protein n=1 Tax=Streptomyces triticagri TaxID=2293568 RepID=A0A372M9D3_9ACTN|nr:DUF397 domain-containing protein [Streptomyces triticagri]RFU87562.1 DUF397 domain-containing protein [Streptomyces triticagri]
MSMSELDWFKSTYSSGSGDDCVEVALDWHKSTYSSGSEGDCVEVAPTPHLIHIRDSKLPDGSRLAVAPAAWVDFLAHAATCEM